jgi:hypothetical protein
MPRTVLHIDRLVLRGVARVDAVALSEALQTELQALLRVPANVTAFAAGDGARVLKAGQVTLAPDSDAGETGRAVAARIAGGTEP